MFRRPSPRDAWQAEQDGLERLIERCLVQPDRHGGISLLPAWRDLIYAKLPAEAREALHAQAAAVRAARGQYTAAAHHHVQAGRPDRAIQVWYPHRAHEIQSGQAGAALAVFEPLSPRRLHEPERQALALLRAELYALTGQAEKALADLGAVRWPPESEANVRAAALRGKFLEALGQREAALAQYEAGLDVIARWQRERAGLHVRRGMVHRRQQELAQAWREACHARYEAEHLQAIVQEQRGDYGAARGHYAAALRLAEELADDESLARIHANLAALAVRESDFALAQAHSQRAVEHYQRTGDQFTSACVHNNLAAMFVQAGQYQAAVETAVSALAYFERIRYPYHLAAAASNLGEAHYGLGHLDEAERYAMLALAQEEPQSMPYALFTLGNVQLAHQELDQAERSFRQAVQFARQNADRFVEAYAWRALGEAHLARRDAPEAGQALREAEQLFEALGMQAEAEATRRHLQQAEAAG